MLRARINNIVFEGSPADIDRAFVIDPDGWSGWDEGPSVRRDEVLRQTAHGAHDLQGFLTPRLVSISGWILAPTPGELEQMRLRLTGLLADGGSGRLVVDSPRGQTWADVRLAGQTTVKVRGKSETEAAFQIQFWAADPRRYGESRTFGPGTSVEAYHYGNFPAHPILEVTGTMSGYTVRQGSRDLVVGLAITSGQTHRINLRTGRLTINGALQVGAVTEPQSWAISPGATWTHQLIPASGSGSLKVIPTDTFI